MARKITNLEDTTARAVWTSKSFPEITFQRLQPLFPLTRFTILHTKIFPQPVALALELVDIIIELINHLLPIRLLLRIKDFTLPSFLTNPLTFVL